MLIKAVIQNMFSFEKKTTIDCTAGREQLHSQYISYVKKYRKKIIPAMCLFGPNGAGKTCFFKSLKLIQQLVLVPHLQNRLIKVEPFLLTKNRKNQSYFCIEFLAENDSIYRYEIKFSPSNIFYESLEKQVGSTFKPIYSRQEKELFIPKHLSKDTQTFFSLIIQNTSNNQLFLNKNNQILSKISPDIGAVVRWFENITFVTPDTKFIPFIIKKDNYELLKNLLNEYGFNIDSISGEEFNFDIMPILIKNDIETNLSPHFGAITIDSDGEFIVTYKEKDKLKSIKLSCWHKIDNNNKVRFNLQQESDGIRRVIELSPVLNILSNGSKERKLIIIDELDRGLHSLLTKHIVRKFIKNSSKDSRNQLIFTSHDLSLIERETLRQDQIFIVDRINSSSVIEKLNDSKFIRSDKDLRKFYMEGKLGGLPTIENIEL